MSWQLSNVNSKTKVYSILWLQQHHHLISKIILRTQIAGLPWGTMDKNPPANGGDMHSTPGLGKLLMLWNNWARVPQLPSLMSQLPRLCAPTSKPTCCNYSSPHALGPENCKYWACVPLKHTTEACMPRACVQQQENPLQWEALIPQRRAAPACHN